MALTRFMQRKPDREIAFCEPTSDGVPAYATLSHTWGQEEVVLQDLEANADMGKTVSIGLTYLKLEPSYPFRIPR